MSQVSRPAAPKTQARKLSAATTTQETWLAVMRMHDGESPRPYSMAEAYAAGEYVSHSVFGPGEVTALIPPDKMDVVFEAGIKRLLCNKA